MDFGISIVVEWKNGKIQAKSDGKIQVKHLK